MDHLHLDAKSGCFEPRTEPYQVSSRQFDADGGKHPWPQVGGGSLNLSHHFNGAARWIHDRAHIDYFGGVLVSGSGVGRDYGQPLVPS